MVILTGLRVADIFYNPDHQPPAAFASFRWPAKSRISGIMILALR
jgi:hypothetical protein